MRAHLKVGSPRQVPDTELFASPDRRLLATSDAEAADRCDLSSSHLVTAATLRLDSLLVKLVCVVVLSHGYTPLSVSVYMKVPEWGH